MHSEHYYFHTEPEAMGTSVIKMHHFISEIAIGHLYGFQRTLQRSREKWLYFDCYFCEQ
jgi:hypothetical protein